MPDSDVMGNVECMLTLMLSAKSWHKMGAAQGNFSQVALPCSWMLSSQGSVSVCVRKTNAGSLQGVAKQAMHAAVPAHVRLTNTQEGAGSTATFIVCASHSVTFP